MFRRILVALCALGLASLVAGTARAAWYYTDLGSLSMAIPQSTATGINSKGQIVGEVEVDNPATGQTNWQPYLWTGGQMSVLSTAGGTGDAWGNGVNDLGQVVGSNSQGGFLYSDGTVTSLAGLAPTAINDAGTIVGGGGAGSFILNPGGSPSVFAPGEGVAYAVNSSGDVAGGGSSYGSEVPTPGWYVNHADGPYNYDLPGLQTGYGAGMYAINDAGLMAGMASSSKRPTGTAVVYSGGLNGTYTDLGSLIPAANQDWGGPFNDSLTGAAYGISQSGDAVGVLAFQNEPYIPAGMHAFFYSAAGNTVVDLNTVAPLPAAVQLLTEATGIATVNGQEWIIGDATVTVGQYGYTHGFLLTPQPYSQVAPLPGDVNLDGRVDVNDLTIVLTNFGKSGMAWNEGDLNGDGTVDVNDLTIVLSSFGQTAASSSPTAVPEPCALALLVAGIGGAVAFGWWKRG